MLVVDLQPVEPVLLEHLDGEGVADPLHVAAVIDVPDEVHGGVAGANTKAFVTVVRQVEFFERLVQTDGIVNLRKVQDHRFRRGHAAGGGVDDHPSGGGNDQLVTSSIQELKVADIEQPAVDGLGPGADGDSIAGVGEAMELDLHARVDPEKVVREHHVKADPEHGGVGAGDLGEVLHDGSRLPLLVEVTFDGVDGEVFVVDEGRLVGHEGARWKGLSSIVTYVPRARLPQEGRLDPMYACISLRGLWLGCWVIVLGFVRKIVVHTRKIRSVQAQPNLLAVVLLHPVYTYSNVCRRL